MALQLHKEKLCCSICLDLPKDPATIPCGHSYCVSCIKSHWDKEDPDEIYSCPHCKQTFTPRPVLVKSAMFADFVEALKGASLEAAPADHRWAKFGDVGCDFCTGSKLKALKSCLVCRVSYCELHLQPHYKSAAFEKHKLVEPLKNLQEKFCSVHDEVMKIFCRSDQQTICILCSMDAHKDHDLVSTSAERNKKQMELGVSREKIQMRIQQKEKDVKVLQQEVETINHSADKAVKDSEKVFTELVCFIEKRSSALREQIRSKQEAEVSRVRKLEEKLKQEIAELRVKDAELEQLSHTDDHIQFLHKYLVLYHLSESTDSPFLNIQPLTYFDDVTVAASQTRDRLQDILSEDWLKISQKVIEVDVLLPHPEPETREEFLQYSRQITLDPNTINAQLSLSAGNRKATVMREKQLYSSHPDRFTDWLQVLSRQSLTGLCYWEVQRSSGGVSVAVTYEDISRTGNESGFGNNDKSWALGCFDQSYYFRHNNIRTVLSGPQSSKIGVFLDHKAGTLSFYSISDTMTLLHKVCTTFTQPLYAGFLIYWAGDSAELCELK
ncbi:E3 ubiquitin/ISG15 ligase TRIM25-like [Acanthochromis polyacanthus]|uniref:E3 ubiquitin/ISG15 ligase TRIM25-like n=1 Tax=Acanthochromis polyacanthus TaxID=80966 RepID=UPI00223426BC|nr:E3 ubiquitin/ISG15 ligase TRIM25-like [Acanthochromis polyacanthus]